jgi:hypothetical protein
VALAGCRSGQAESPRESVGTPPAPPFSRSVRAPAGGRKHYSTNVTGNRRVSPGVDERNAQSPLPRSGGGADRRSRPSLELRHVEDLSLSKNERGRRGRDAALGSGLSGRTDCGSPATGRCCCGCGGGGRTGPRACCSAQSWHTLGEGQFAAQIPRKLCDVPPAMLSLSKPSTSAYPSMSMKPCPLTLNAMTFRSPVSLHLRASSMAQQML